METSKQQLFKQLSQSFPQLTGNDAVPLTIKMGRNVVFNGTLDAPAVDKLTESQLVILESALNAPANDGSSLEAGSPKGTIKIEVGDQKVFRYANGQVEINAIQPAQLQQELEVPITQTDEVLVSAYFEDMIEHFDQLIKIAPIPDREAFAASLDVALGFQSAQHLLYSIAT